MNPHILKALTPHNSLPAGRTGTLVGRAWLPGNPAGPGVVAVRDGLLFDLSETTPTMSDLCNSDDPLAVAQNGGRPVGALEDVLLNSVWTARDSQVPWLLSPVDLQVVKASGVTFAESLLERVIEERAGGDRSEAEAIRGQIVALIGEDLSQIVPGSKAAMELKAHLVEAGSWSQYLEVGIGPDAEVFTKASPTSSVGTGAQVGIRRDSSWNNPEPELVLVVSAEGAVVGATLGNDVNLRDFEGRSALLLGEAKDNNAAASLGPFIRLLDETLDMDDLRTMTIDVSVHGEEGFEMVGTNSMSKISRDIADLVSATIGLNHQYPDGLALFLGTMFAPTDDRDEAGQGFTHKVGDVVQISSDELGTLVNSVDHCDRIEPWTFGVGALMRNLGARGLLAP